jgi:hypothetical protein
MSMQFDTVSAANTFKVLLIVALLPTTYCYRAVCSFDQQQLQNFEVDKFK